MPAKAPSPPGAVVAILVALGQTIRAQRKALGINGVTASQAAGMSRVTWHRIEKGEPSVTMGAYLNALAALDLHFEVSLPGKAAPSQSATQGWIPARVRLADYPQLQQLAWQVQSDTELTPLEALAIYERNARHLDSAALQPHEKALMDALRTGLGGNVNVQGAGHV